ncbi:MAG TPA: ABC transporter permease subunit [Gemmatimonadaceae bacterium]|jgi:NitT/TauT family transport system permease protein
MSFNGLRQWISPALALVGLLAMWEVAGRVTDASTPVPTKIVRSLASDSRFYLENTAVTMFEAVGGLVIAIVIAYSTASLFAFFAPVRRAIFPLVIASQTIPLIAVAPVLATLIGDGMFSRIFITAWLCWFPLVVSATHGLLHVAPEHYALFATYGASRSDVFWKLRVPNCTGTVLAGMRAAAGFAFIGAIVVEYSGATKGLGAFLIAQARQPTDPVRVFGVVVVSALSGLLLTQVSHGLVRYLLRRYLPAEQ